MTAVNTKSSKQFTYSRKTLERAERALICSPFELKLFQTMRLTSVPLKAIARPFGTEQGYTRHPLSELAAENVLLWLIQVGLLRREVDGQGITDSFRLTPLGHQLIEQYQETPWGKPSWLDYIYNILIRWVRWPF
jgi:hypothetical protein